MDDFTIYDFDPNNTSPEVLQALGLLVLEANELEATARSILGEMLNMNPRSAAIALQRQTVGSIFETIVDLIDDRPEHSSDCREFREAVRKGQAAYNKRNARVHSSFFKIPGSGQSLTNLHKVKAGKSRSPVTVSAEEIRAEADAIHDAYFEMYFKFEALNWVRGKV